MNRLYSSLLAATALTFTAAAQQLPNAGFEDGWSACTPWVTGSRTPKTVGETPANWKIAQVAGYYVSFLGLGWQGATVVGQKVEGYNNSSSAIFIENTHNPVLTTQKVPGYFTLGTSWNTATTNAENKDGGSFGGIEFAYTPDAISFQYKRDNESGSDQHASVVAYAWKGTYTQKDVPGNIGSQDLCTMTDRDRNILGMTTSQGGEVSKTNDAALISVIDHSITGIKTEWTYLEIPFEYKSTSEKPSKLNVIFSAGDYFSETPVEGNDLTVDDVKLLYYSRLKSLKVNGTDVTGFDPNKYEYTVDAVMPEDASAISTECLGNSGSGKAEVALDKANNKATITVANSNAGGTDVDGETSHVYTVNFKAAEDPAEVVETLTFEGLLSVDMSAIDESMGKSDMEGTPVILQKMSNGTYTLLLEKFGATDEDPVGMGDITFENVKLDGTQLSGEKALIKLNGGIEAVDNTLEGTLEGDKLSLKLNIYWKMGDNKTPIYVTFNGTRSTSAIGGIESDVIDENAPVEYYNIQGVKVNGDNLAPGFYIVRQGKKVSKIFVK